MVQSGLVDIPYVSSYRLAAHLLLAFAMILFGIVIGFYHKIRQMEVVTTVRF